MEVATCHRHSNGNFAGFLVFHSHTHAPITLSVCMAYAHIVLFYWKSFRVSRVRAYLWAFIVFVFSCQLVFFIAPTLPVPLIRLVYRVTWFGYGFRVRVFWLSFLYILGASAVAIHWSSTIWYTVTEWNIYQPHTRTHKERATEKKWISCKEVVEENWTDRYPRNRHFGFASKFIIGKIN